VHLLRGLGGYWNLWVSSRSLQHSGFWYGFRDHGPFDLCFCQYKTCDISTRGLRLPGANDVVKVYIPSTMVASGGVASTPGATVSP
jgi:hypothetical protein